MSPLTKTIHIPESYPITEPMILELVELLDGGDLTAMSRTIRMLTFYYLNREHQELSAEFQVFMKELPALFDFLDVVEDELEHINSGLGPSAKEIPDADFVPSNRE